MADDMARQAQGATLDTCVHDVHSRLQRIRVAEVRRPATLERLAESVRDGAASDAKFSVSGSRHAMGAQQFGTDTVLLDLRDLAAIRGLDSERGLLRVEAGIQWPSLIQGIHDLQRSGSTAEPCWSIRQKQTGADDLTLGGTIAANGHGRGLSLPPFVSEIESLTLIDADGSFRRCSRECEAELFAHACGGYGLFGVIAEVELRLHRRRKLRRQVEILSVEEAVTAFEERIAEGFLYGDLQIDLDETSERFLQRGVFSCYAPVDPEVPMPASGSQRRLTVEDWKRLLLLTHVDRGRAWEEYAGHYLATSGQLYWSDTHQLSTYLDGYHEWLDRELGATHPATEIITEVYVPRSRLADFLAEVAEDFRAQQVLCIYSTVRLIEPDRETALPWAKDRYACIIFNVHTEHTQTGLERSAAALRRLIDQARSRGGSFFLTYHRYADREQLLSCYPELPAFLTAKRRYDPAERFTSDWYRQIVQQVEG